MNVEAAYKTLIAILLIAITAFLALIVFSQFMRIEIEKLKLNDSVSFHKWYMSEFEAQ